MSPVSHFEMTSGRLGSASVSKLRAAETTIPSTSHSKPGTLDLGGRDQLLLVVRAVGLVSYFLQCNCPLSQTYDSWDLQSKPSHLSLMPTKFQPGCDRFSTKRTRGILLKSKMCLEIFLHYYFEGPDTFSHMLTIWNESPKNHVACSLSQMLSFQGKNCSKFMVQKSRLDPW